MPSIGPRADSGYCIVCLAEPENGDAGSSGPQSGAQELAGLDLDVRERIYDMVRPLDWMEEAPEPPGAPLFSLWDILLLIGCPCGCEAAVSCTVLRAPAVSKHAPVKDLQKEVSCGNQEAHMRGLHQRAPSTQCCLHPLQAWPAPCEGTSGEPWPGWQQGKQALQRLIRRAAPPGPLLASPLQQGPPPSGVGAPTQHGSESSYPAACRSTTTG